MRALTCLASGLLLGLLSAAPAGADVVHLRGGGQLEGDVVDEGDHLLVRGRYGSTRVERERVLRVEETRDAWDELRELREGVGLPLVELETDELYRYAQLSREVGDERERRRALETVLLRDPDHEGARRALGFVRHAGRWVTVEERHRALGHVQHEGRWVTPAERDRLLAEAAQRRAEEARLAAERAAAEARRQEAQAEAEAEWEVRLAAAREEGRRAGRAAARRALAQRGGAGGGAGVGRGGVLVGGSFVGGRYVGGWGGRGFYGGRSLGLCGGCGFSWSACRCGGGTIVVPPVWRPGFGRPQRPTPRQPLPAGPNPGQPPAAVPGTGGGRVPGS